MGRLAGKDASMVSEGDDFNKRRLECIDLLRRFGQRLFVLARFCFKGEPLGLSIVDLRFALR